MVRILYILSSGTNDATKASIPVHLAVNGSIEVADQPEILLAGDGAELATAGALDATCGVGVPPMAELFEKVRQHEIPVHV